MASRLDLVKTVCKKVQLTRKNKNRPYLSKEELERVISHITVLQGK